MRVENFDRTSVYDNGERGEEKIGIKDYEQLHAPSQGRFASATVSSLAGIGA
jgi:hypothetical protein